MPDRDIEHLAVEHRWAAIVAGLERDELADAARTYLARHPEVPADDRLRKAVERTR